MLKNFEDGYEVSGSNAIAAVEKNDCTVRAIANACGIDYTQAHGFVARTFKRKKGKGVKGFMDTLDKITDTAIQFDKPYQPSLFTDGPTVKTIRGIGKSPKKGGTLANPQYKHKKVAYTVKSFAQQFTKGNYIVVVDKHALAINDGVVIDNSNYQHGGYRRPVEGAYQVQ